MNRLLPLTCFCVALAVAAAFADDAAVAGRWKLSYTTAGTEVPLAILEVESKDGKPTGKLVSSRLKGAELESFAVDNGLVTATLKASGRRWNFEGKPQGGKVPGSVALDSTVLLASLTKTDEAELPARLPAAGSGGLTKELTPLRQQLAKASAELRKAKDGATQKDLRNQVRELTAKLDSETYRIYREFMEKGEKDPAVFDAAVFLFRGAGKRKATAKEVEGWVTTAVAQASAHGPRWQQKVAFDVASALAGSKEHAGLALEQARVLEKSLTDKTPAERQVEVLGVLAKALRTLGRDDDAKPVQSRLNRVDAKLDTEYLAKMPPFKGTPYAGRKGDSKRVVVMELFTGAQCPPCVAADVAFDVLEKTYKPSELVLLQYHLHIPGPDPLTCPDSVARYEQYTKAFPKSVGGTPSTLFNGKPEARGGGGIDRAEAKYEEYCKVIDPMLEAKTRVSVRATATRKEDDVAISVSVADVDRAEGGSLKLRLALVEETVRYVGSNRLRFHHQVVRAMPGGPGGIELKDKASDHTLKVNLADLRKKQNNYLDDYAANQRPFPYADRPMDLAKLRVVAMVQDDSTHEILQATMVDVGADPAVKRP